MKKLTLILTALFSLSLLFLAGDSNSAPAAKKEKKAEKKAKNDGKKAKKAEKKEKKGPSKEVLALGKKKYDMMCKVCHGEKGYGDGVAGKALNPKPSAFGKGEFRYGNSFKNVLEIITKGTKKGMAPYGYLPENERKALAHYVLFLSGAYGKKK